MEGHTLGIVCGLAVSVSWTVSALAFTAASKRVGSVPVNLLRLLVAMLLLTLAGWAVRGVPLPTDATRSQWLWLGLSGVIGFFFCDWALFRAFVLIGARLSTLMMSLAPVFAATIAFAVLGEKLRGIELAGILVTIAGVVWVILERHPAGDDAELARQTRRQRRAGLLLALAAAILQAITAVIIKHATREGDYHAFAMTQVRAITAIPCFVLLVLISGRVGDTVRSLGNRDAMVLLCIGAVFGPFLGVTLFNESVKHVPTGVTQTLSALVPVMILPFAIYVMKERVTWRAALGATVSVAGVALLAMAGE